MSSRVSKSSIAELLRERRVQVLIGLAFALLVVGVAGWLYANDRDVSHQQTSVKTTKSPTASTKNTTATPGQPPTTGAPAATQTDGDKAITTKVDKDACQALTLATAKLALGNGVTLSGGGTVTTIQNTDSKEQTCTYTSGDKTLQLAVHYAQSSLGRSSNTVAFGSGKPAGVEDKTGYGQAAYWNPADNSLNILDSNDWYILTLRGGGFSNLQPAADAMAKVLP